MGWKGPGKIFEKIGQAYHDVRDVTQPEWFQDASTKVAKVGEDAARDVWNTTSQLPGQALGALTGSEKVQNLVSPQTWEEWGKPGEAFYNDFNEKSGILPPDWRQYAPAVVGTALNFVPGVGPLLSAGFNTLYNAGGMQANQKGMNWGKVGTNALTNFGTAAVSMGAASALKGAQSAQVAQAGTTSLGRSSALAANAAARIPAAGATLSAGKTLAGAGSNLATGIQAYNNANSSALSSFNNGRSSAYSATPGSSTSETSIPSANAKLSVNSNAQGLIGSGVDRAYNNTMTSLTPEEMAKGQLVGLATSTLAPKGSEAISGIEGGYDPITMGGAKAPDYVPGSAFDAFYSGNNVYNQDTYDQGMQALADNAYRQKTNVFDTFLPTGQDMPEPNTPFNSQLQDLYTSTGQGVQDYTNTFNTKAQEQQKAGEDMNTASQYKEFFKMNPQVTDEAMAGYLKNPAQFTDPNMSGLMTRFSTYNNPLVPLMR